MLVLWPICGRALCPKIVLRLLIEEYQLLQADVFISYRREDTRADAGRLYDRLSARFGDDHVFMDIEDIEPGANFVEVLERTLAACGALIVLIGERWLAASGRDGSSRLDDEKDFVRIEIEKALARRIQLIPVLVGGAEMPRAEQLPASLSELCEHHALELSDARFHSDVDGLIAVLEAAAGRSTLEVQGTRWRPALLAAAAVAVVLAGLGLWRWHGDSPLPLRQEGGVLSRDQVVAMLVGRDFYHASWNAGAQGLANRYTAEVQEGKAVVVDAASGLMWARAGSGMPMLRERAEEFIAKLNAEGLAGYANWRLPTLEEAMSLVDPEPHPNAGWHLDPVFEQASGAYVWTADQGAEGRHWVVYFGDGTCLPESASFNAQVRAVRGERD